jgi:O-antigen/teichoic acid export membrane protein
MSIYYRVDSVMLERMLLGGEVQAGIYAQAFRILDAFTMFAFLFATLLLPMFSRMIKRGEPVEELSVFSFLLLMIPVLIISLSLIFYRLEFMEILYNEHTNDSSKILAVLMFAHIFVSATYISGTLLTAGGYLRSLNITAGSGLLLNVALNIFLIPKYQALGSAAASLITQILVVGIQSFLVFRLFKFGSHQKVLFKLILFTIFVIALAWSSTQLDFSWLIRIFAVMVISMIVALFSGLIRMHILVSLFQTGEEKPGVD